MNAAPNTAMTAAMNAAFISCDTHTHTRTNTDGFVRKASVFQSYKMQFIWKLLEVVYQK